MAKETVLIEQSGKGWKVAILLGGLVFFLGFVVQCGSCVVMVPAAGELGGEAGAGVLALGSMVSWAMIGGGFFFAVFAMVGRWFMHG